MLVVLTSKTVISVTSYLTFSFKFLFFCTIPCDSHSVLEAWARILKNKIINLWFSSPFKAAHELTLIVEITSYNFGFSVCHLNVIWEFGHPEISAISDNRMTDIYNALLVDVLDCLLVTDDVPLETPLCAQDVCEEFLVGARWHSIDTGSDSEWKNNISRLLISCSYDLGLYEIWN